VATGQIDKSKSHLVPLLPRLGSRRAAHCLATSPGRVDLEGPLCPKLHPLCQAEASLAVAQTLCLASCLAGALLSPAAREARRLEATGDPNRGKTSPVDRRQRSV
jgi:hypothetical protein